MGLCGVSRVLFWWGRCFVFIWGYGSDRLFTFWGGCWLLGGIAFVFCAGWLCFLYFLFVMVLGVGGCFVFDRLGGSKVWGDCRGVCCVFTCFLVLLGLGASWVL